MKRILTINNVSLKYGDNYAIKHINFEMFTGDIVALVGHNGAGKSSLFNIIAGIQEPTEGFVAFDQAFIKQRLFASIGFSPQSQVMDWYTNVWDNVYLGSQLAGFDTKMGEKLTRQSLQLLNILDLKDKAVDTLSGGQQQRVQIARAIVHQPDFYLLDEPTTGLDAETSDSLLAYLKDEANKHKAVFISSHDLHLLEKYCNKLVLIDKGRILYAGELQVFLEHHAPQKSYIINTDKKLEQLTINRLSKEGLSIQQLAPYQYQFILNPEMDLAQLFTCIADDFKVIEIVKEMMSLRDLYIDYREGGVK